ncbi:hypothetical protein PGTUg99_033733 [Puccinia graminis f. sp. tritici]|uniref:Uncharacterized protein n=1 Tax=Puccinia graminis f. sp. tritici TaxID=56615 RepID=A0A5B0RQD4_PUCGR|nr:hypothetical protein PGTUg99_033733 [Puccinia graminis f. sp. tritici]
MDEDSLVVDFFMKKPTTRKQSSASPTVTNRTNRTTATPINNRTPTTPRIWADSIPRRPKEQAHSSKQPRQPGHLKPHPYSTSTTPRSPICSSTTLGADTHSPTRSISPTSPPPLPPPLEFSSPIRSCTSTGLSTTVSPSINPSSTRRFKPKSIPPSTRKSVRPPPSPCVQFEPSSRVLVPDSTDSPPQDLPSPPPDDIDETHYSDPESLPPERDFDDFYKTRDPVPQKLFNSSPSPPELRSCHVNSSAKSKGKAREIDPCQDLNDETDEEERRDRLLADLGFEEEREEEMQPTEHESFEPFSSSPIEIIRPARKPDHHEKMPSKELTTTKQSVDKWKPSIAGSSAQKTGGIELSEREDELTIQQIESGSSFPQQEHEPSLLLASQEDQIKHIGLVIDDSEDEDGSSSSGIAPLMDSWPASKRCVFLKMAGLSSEDGPNDEGSQAQATEDWDRLLGKAGKRNGATGAAKKVVKKAWYNRSVFRAKKRGSKSFKGVGKSARRVK